jgi:hypothetical protein
MHTARHGARAVRVHMRPSRPWQGSTPCAVGSRLSVSLRPAPAGFPLLYTRLAGGGSDATTRRPTARLNWPVVAGQCEYEHAAATRQSKPGASPRPVVVAA